VTAMSHRLSVDMGQTSFTKTGPMELSGGNVAVKSRYEQLIAHIPRNSGLANLFFGKTQSLVTESLVASGLSDSNKPPLKR
jgi:hypothetical protein